MIKILCIEDDEQGRFLLKLYFQGTDFQVCMENDGKSAIHFLEENDVDIILMDWNLPFGLSGRDLVHQISELDRHHNTPVVVYTADNSLLAKHFEDQPKVVGVLHKPITRDVFLNSLGEFCAEQELAGNRLMSVERNWIDKKQVRRVPSSRTNVSRCFTPCFQLPVGGPSPTKCGNSRSLEHAKD